MAIIRSSDFFQPPMPSIFNNFFKGDMWDWMNSNFSSGNSTLPAINVKENENEFCLEVAAPGMKKEDFKIRMENGLLTISSERREEMETPETKGYSRREFNYQSFQRSFSIPEDIVDGEKIQAKYHDGILDIHLPKKEEVKPKPAKEISIG